MVAGSLLLFIWHFARLLSRHGRQQREFLAGTPLNSSGRTSMCVVAREWPPRVGKIYARGHVGLSSTQLSESAGAKPPDALLPPPQTMC